MYAILETGGKQYKVRPGDTLQVEKLPGEAGDMVELGRVLMVADDDAVAFGTPTVEDARVVAEVVDQRRGPKIIVFKYKAKVRYRRKTGHRQSLTTLRITEIRGPGGKSSRAANVPVTTSSAAPAAESAPAPEAPATAPVAEGTAAASETASAES